MEWIDIKTELLQHLKQCAFKLNDGFFAVGKCQYFEHGDSELIEMYGKSLCYVIHSYRNWERPNTYK